MEGEHRVLCKQCERPFVPKSKVNVYCSQQCRWDHQNLRDANESRLRRETGFAWDPVRPAHPVEVRRPKTGKPVERFHVAKGWKTALILPDQQFGYRFFPDGSLDPFQDPRAIDVVEQVAEAERPHKTVMLGDVNDLPTYGRFRQEPEFVWGVQPGIDRASVHVATIAEVSGETDILEGNHDLRIQLHTLDNALASAGLRRARRGPHEYPVMTMPFFLGIEEMPNVRWVGGYPGNATYINANLACVHEGPLGQNPAGKQIQRERVSTVFGHVHRWVDEIQTFNHQGRPVFVRAHSPGCLCRIDGAVPSSKSGRDPFQRPVTHWENWQQGFTVVRYLEGDGRFTLEPVPIFEGEAMHRGEIFRSDKVVNDPERHLLGVDYQQRSTPSGS